MIIDKKKISDDQMPYIIAELSANHGGSIERAKQSIEKVAKTGVSAVKIQTYTPDTMTINSDLPDFLVKDGLWAGRTLYDLYSEAYTPFEWHKELFKHASDNKISIFSTPFDESAVDLLEELDTPAYKIASFEIVDIPLLKYIAKKNKPILMSTGMATLEEIENAVNTVRKETEADLLLFHCISSYPTVTADSNLNNLTKLKKKFGVHVGLSDHTTNNIASLTAIGMGAVAIEKHFKVDDKECGPDASFSLNLEQIQSLVKECNQAWMAKGGNDFSRSASEEQNLVFRRSLYFIKKLKKGQIIKESDIRRIRPGYGLEPKYLNKVIGEVLSRDVNRGEPVSLDILKSFNKKNSKWNYIDEQLL